MQTTSQDNLTSVFVNPSATAIYFNRAFQQQAGEIWGCTYDSVRNTIGGCNGLFPGFAGPTTVVASTTTVYASDQADGQVWSYPLPSGPAAPLIQDNVGKPYLLALDSQYVYWASQGSTNTNIRRAPLAGGATETVVSNYPGTINHIAADGKYVYFSGADTSNNGVVAYAFANGGANNAVPSAPVNMFSGSDEALSVTAGGDAVFWYDQTSPKVMAVAAP
jgi:hypothetical protein